MIWKNNGITTFLNERETQTLIINDKYQIQSNEIFEQYEKMFESG